MPEPALIAEPLAPQRTGLAALLDRPRAILTRNPVLRRAAVPAAASAAVLLGVLAWMILSGPERTPLFQSLPDADKAAVVAALEKQGFAVRLDPKTGAVLLPPAEHARARMALAGEGLPKAAPGAIEMLDGMPLGTSRAVEAMRLRHAQERELAAAIESLDGVERARVLIAWPEPSPFVRERPPVSASVTVTLAPGRTLSDHQARAILHLVAGAVPGLSTDHVAIADQTGRLLAGEPGGRDAAGDRRVALQARLEARARDAILSLLGPLLGPENVAAQVSIELDFASREAASERFEPQGSVRSESESRSTSSEPRPIGIPGALTNTVPAAPQVQAEAPPQAQGPAVNATTSESRTRNYEVGRSVEVTVQGGGAVRRISAAVVVNEAALGPPNGRAARLRELERLVAGAIGADPGRGDRIEVAARPFAPAAAPARPIWQEPVVVESSRWLAIALVTLGLLAFVVRPLVRALAAEAEAERTERAARAAAAMPQTQASRLIDYAGKLTEARMIASTDAARATAIARRLLADSPHRLPASGEAPAAAAAPASAGAKAG